MPEAGSEPSTLASRAAGHSEGFGQSFASGTGKPVPSRERMPREVTSLRDFFFLSPVKTFVLQTTEGKNHLVFRMLVFRMTQPIPQERQGKKEC